MEFNVSEMVNGIINRIILVIFFIGCATVIYGSYRGCKKIIEVVSKKNERKEIKEE